MERDDDTAAAAAAEVSEAETQYKNARRVLLTLHSQLEVLESGADQSVFMQGKIATNINALSRVVAQLPTYAKAMPVDKRELWTVKCRQLAEDEKHVRAAMERFLLLAHAARSAASSSSSSAISAAAMEHRDARLQRLAQDGQSLTQSQRVANEIREVGVAILERLRDQNKTLKRARRQMWNIAHTLGLSRTLLRIIERRQWQDQILVYGGMLITLLLLALLVYLFRW